ncbi:MAG: hypothetical protein IKF29_00490 [Oceanobacillus sp.]|nr:hypothetical protein [Oceanobacillus sp.]
MSKLCIKFDDAKEVIKSILEQFYGLNEDAFKNEFDISFENVIEYLFQELEQKGFYPKEEKMLACDKGSCKYRLPCGICKLYMMIGDKR